MEGNWGMRLRVALCALRMFSEYDRGCCWIGNPLYGEMYALYRHFSSQKHMLMVEVSEVVFCIET